MIDTTTTGYYTQTMTTISFMQSCLAAFIPPTTTSSSIPSITILQPPPMQNNCYHDLLISGRAAQSTVTTFVSPLWGMTCGVGGYSSSSSIRIPSHQLHRTSLFDSSTTSTSSNSSGSTTKETTTQLQKEQQSTIPRIRIAIIGGGIAGVTAANALSKKFASSSSSYNDDENSNSIDAKIVVFEGDIEGGNRCVDFDKSEQPVWTAATARNANSLVPGAAMHIMSQRKTLLKIAKDTAREWYSEQVESIQHWLQTNGYYDKKITKNIDNFDVVPPYFALHLFRCIGPSATRDERATFITFCKQFTKTSLLSGETEANERGRYIQQLAKSNRYLFLEAMNGGDDGKALATKIGLGKGFLSLHRTSEGAMAAFKEGELFGEASRILSFREAIKLEPRIANLPMGDTFAVHRVDDYTANSALFVQDLLKKVQRRGIEYRCGEVGMVEDISQTTKHHTKNEKSANSLLATSSTKQQSRFKIITKDGQTHDFDYLVLAAGVNTPLFARKLGIAERCPTYPLRGYSLTVYTNHTITNDDTANEEKGPVKNLLKMPISVDDMYCSSVGGNQARMAGFGELVGYRDKAVNVPSLAPRVMARYAKALFPDSNVIAEPDLALQCFRPCSPDDIPIVGELGTLPGLYMHTGHGTLGWTLCLSTSECLAQALHDSIKGNTTQSTYKLPGDIEVERDRISPNRFL